MNQRSAAGAEGPANFTVATGGHVTFLVTGSKTELGGLCKLLRSKQVVQLQHSSSDKRNTAATEAGRTRRKSSYSNCIWCRRTSLSV